MGRFGLSFSVRAADVDETMSPSLCPEDAVQQVSARKAAAIPADGDTLVLAADTIVVCGGQILGKPHSQAEAAEMLRLLSGREHQVITAVTLRQGERVLTRAETTRVWFDPLDEAAIAAYIASGEPMDKAGAYGIQGLASIFVDKLDGDYYNVMGLPLCTLAQMLWQFGINIL